MTPLTPTKIERTADDVHRAGYALRIQWSDGSSRLYRPRALRDACPCATCREKRSAPAPSPLALTVLTEAELRPLEVLGMRPVGSYAYHIDFSDGHNTGLFGFDLLHRLGDAEGGAPAGGE